MSHHDFAYLFLSLALGMNAAADKMRELGLALIESEKDDE